MARYDSLTLAYMAGIFDAEGCVTIAEKTPWVTKKAIKRLHHRMACKVSQKYGNVLELFCEYFGGTVFKPKNNTPFWDINASKALNYLQTVEPFLIVKKEEAQVAINFQKRKIEEMKHYNSNHMMSNDLISFNQTQYLLLKELKFKKLKQLPLMEIHPIEQIYAYLAGFFDGEGFIGIATLKRKRGGMYHYLVATVTQSDRDYVLLELFRYFFGGVIGKSSTKGLHEWKVCSRKAKVLLEILEPYLRIKKRQAQVGLEFQAGVHIKRGAAKLITEQEMAVREVQRIMLHNLKKENIQSDGIS